MSNGRRLDQRDWSFISQNVQSPHDLLNIIKVNDGTVYKMRGCPSKKRDTS